MSQDNKYYTIKAGFAEAKEVERGEINRSTGLPAAVTEKATAVVGKISIPNFSRVWGKRTLHEGKPTGDWTPLKWGLAEGELIDVRYLKNCKSLDKRYQESIGLKPGDNDGYIHLNYGLNDFNPVTHPALVQMLKIHTYNGDSICRDPANRNVIFNNYDEQAVVDKSLQVHELKYDAMNMVMEVKSNPGKLKVFARICNIDDKKQDKIIIGELMNMIADNAGLFIDQVNWYKNYAHALIAKANDFQLLRLDVPGEVQLVDDNSGPILDKLSSKMAGKKKLEYMTENAMEPAVYDAVERIKKALAAYEMQLN